MVSSLCLNSCAVPRAAKQSLSSLIQLHKFPSFLPNKHCISRASASVSVSLSDKKELRSPDLVALEYADLNLTDKISQELGHVRIRQHVNPLSSSGNAVVNMLFLVLDERSDAFCLISFWFPCFLACFEELYLNGVLYYCPLSRCQPLYLIGVKSSRILHCPLWWILEVLVKRAEFWVKELALSNIHFIFANAAVSFRQLVSAYPRPLMLVSILCPDPHFKKRHQKRRVVQKPLVDSILTSLMPEGKVFIQSDVLEVAEDMRKQLDAESDVLQHIDMVDPSVLCDDEGWLLNNPMGIRTEREIHAEFEGAKIYRRLYQKKRGAL